MAAGRYLAGRLGTPVVLRTAMVVCIGLSMLPDADVLAFRFGIPYHDQFGHRGFSHSLLVAFLFGVAGAIVAKLKRWPVALVGITTAALVASHGLLDTLSE